MLLFCASNFVIIENPLYFRGCLHGGRKILEGGTTFACFTCRNFGRSGDQEQKEKKNSCRPLAAERPATAVFVLVVPRTRIFRAKARSLAKYNFLHIN